MMSQSYEAEQKPLEAEVIALRQEIDPCMLRELIKAIDVEAPAMSSRKRKQNIHIQQDGIGFIPWEKLMKKETA